jgi:hypothetical protein
MKKAAASLFFSTFIAFLPACIQHTVEVAPVEIKPIHITIDVNVKIDKALDDFFGDIDQTAKDIKPRTVQ